jgi:uncharacterized protein (DUF2267 family)
MSQTDFIKLVRTKGRYGSEGEASRAVNAVFSTVKSWLPPSASDVMRKVLPQDASRLWRFSPMAFGGVDAAGAGAAQPRHFVLRVQQAGRYESSGEAMRAASSVLGVLARALPGEPSRFLRRMLPRELMDEKSSSDAGWAA